MNKYHKVIDAKGLPCPKPVILTKKAMNEGGFDSLEVIIDNEAAFENVARYIEYADCEIENKFEKNGIFHVLAKVKNKIKSKAPEIPEELAVCAIADNNKGNLSKNIFISSDKIGHGKDDLGALLMRGFIYTLTEVENQPKRIIMMNSGVLLALEGSSSLENLQKLAQNGIEILVCGTCLEFYGLKDKLEVGKVSNMYEITEALLDGQTVSVG
jgi:selenium metabolism protein YedF